MFHKSKALEGGLLLSFAIVALVSGGLIESNETATAPESAAAASIPFPGYDWLERIASEDTQITLPSGETYSSAYAAFMYGAPWDYPCRNFNAWINSIFFGSNFAATLVEKFGVEWGHYVLCYLRNFVGAMIVYYGTGGIFHYFCYIHPMSKDLWKDRVRPSSEIMWHQIQLSQASLTLYVFLPVVDEWLVESGWTRAYYTVEEIGGWPQHIATMLFYFFCVEVGIYWAHRTLHTNKWLYRNIHLRHHYYKKPEQLTPWCSIAFHPLDGILQASPYVAMLPLVPCHYATHFLLLFFTAIWATYIHDSLDWNIYPIMGSKYHTIHHTHYMYNHGQVFIFCDWFWGTLLEPEGPTGVASKGKTL